MNYEEFVITVREELTRLYADEAEVVFRCLSKVNMDRQDAVSVLLKGRSISPIVYMKPLFEEYEKGKRMVDILADVVKMVELGENLDIPVDRLDDWEYVKDRIGAKLIPVEGNTAYLRDLPHRVYMDLALVYYLMFDTPETPSGTAMVTHAAMRSWEVSEQELYEQSQINLPGILEPRIFYLEDVLDEMCTGRMGIAEDLLKRKSVENRCGLFVVTNEKRWLGAISVFYEGVLDLFMRLTGWEDIYLIPSSIHEMLILPWASGDEARLLDMVAEVNETTVAPADRLSYSVYRYTKKEGVMRRISGEEKMPKHLYAIAVV